MHFRVLGPLEVLDRAGRPLAITGPKERILLAALLISPGEVVSADRLIDMLWPSSPPSNPQNALQARVSALRRSLGDREMIAGAGSGYRLRAQADDVDSVRFERLLSDARRASGGGPGSSLELYDQALALWRGSPFVDVEYHDFARSEISRLEELWIGAREERIQAMLDAGRHREVLGDLEALVLDHPLRERLWGQLMLALYRSGRQAEALRAYQQAAGCLGEELGIEPSLELRQLEEAILVQDPRLASPSADRERPLHNLPARITSLVGRSADVERVVALLSDHRLVTLTGPGGVGKTSLAVACGEQVLERFRDGVWLVELAGMTDPSLVPNEIARSLKLEVGDGSTLELICEVLQGRNLLIVLDNCEHLIDAAAVTANAVLRQAPRVQVMATSREPLGVPGEILWPTRPLSVPGSSPGLEPQAHGSVQLFVERAQAVQPDFRLDEDATPSVVDICQRLDGLPLALELAAARVRTLPVGEIAVRLDDRFRLLRGGSRALLPRQQTLEATIAWSYELLDEDERDLFRRLSVFAGGWSLPAAEHIGREPGRVLDLLFRLADRSLIVSEHLHGRTRFSMLETIREFARRRLEESGEAAALVHEHARWSLALAEAAELQGPEQLEWTRVLSEEHENLRAGIDGALEQGDAGTALRLAGGLGWWWFFGNRDEGRTILDRLLSATVDQRDLARVSALHARALLDFFGPTDRTLQLAEEALELSVALDDAPAAATSKVFVALSGVYGSSTSRSLRLLDEAVEAFRECEEVWGEGFARFQRMEVVAHEGNLRAAIDEGERALSLMEKTGDPWAISAVLAHLGRYGRLTGRPRWARETTQRALEMAMSRRLPHTLQFVMTDQAYLELAEGDHPSARRMFEEALAVATDVGNQVGVAANHNGLAEAWLAAGEMGQARRFHEKALARYEGIGLHTGVAYTASRLGLVEECAGSWEEAAALHRRGLDAAVASGDVVDSIPCVEGTGRLALALGDPERAARLLAGAGILRRRTGLAPLPLEADANERACETIGRLLGAGWEEALGVEMEEMETAALSALAAGRTRSPV